MAFVIYTTKLATGKRSESITPERAKWILENLNNPSDDLTESQQAYLMRVQNVYTSKPDKLNPADKKEVLNTLTNIGVLQGKSEIMPRGDR